jgi:CHAT domain-containing protein
VGAARRVLIVPHGPLHGVPFAALNNGRHALIDDHELCHAPNATVALTGLGRDPVAPQRALLVGGGAGLPAVDAEIDALAQLFPRARRLQGADASVAELRRQAGRAELLHLACHAEFRADSPLFSALHLADGVLSAAQIEALPLSAALVVLSACDTALGDTGAGDEGVGLVRAFLIAGAQRVLGSQWQVDDAGTAAFMQGFHRIWRGGGSAAAALRRAQLDRREQAPHPYHWAAFSLHGGG